mmetsp:Transcript_24482/g.53489  ORF Transcript_24482/g.53489 Transcript_24482/m.53489 type:complete len:250 (+) Transcript_24482:579-1328(+)
MYTHHSTAASCFELPRQPLCSLPHSCCCSPRQGRQMVGSRCRGQHLQPLAVGLSDSQDVTHHALGLGAQQGRLLLRRCWPRQAVTDRLGGVCRGCQAVAVVEQQPHLRGAQLREPLGALSTCSGDDTEDWAGNHCWISGLCCHWCCFLCCSILAASSCLHAISSNSTGRGLIFPHLGGVLCLLLILHTARCLSTFLLARGLLLRLPCSFLLGRLLRCLGQIRTHDLRLALAICTQVRDGRVPLLQLLPA